MRAIGHLKQLSNYSMQEEKCRKQDKSSDCEGSRNFHCQGNSKKFLFEDLDVMHKKWLINNRNLV